MGSFHFWSKTAEHSVWYTRKPPIMKWENALRESSKKKFTEAEHSLSQHHQLVH